jgi:hypothetical protein
MTPAWLDAGMDERSTGLTASSRASRAGFSTWRSGFFSSKPCFLAQLNARRTVTAKSRLVFSDQMAEFASMARLT